MFKGIFYGCLAGISYGTNPLGALHLYKEGLAPDTVLCYRFTWAILMLAAVMFFNGKFFNGTPRSAREIFAVKSRDLRVIAILGVLFAISALTLFASFNYMDAGLASTLLFLYPLEVAVIMGLFFKEKLTPTTAVSIAISLAGISLLYKGGENGIALNTTGLILVFLSSLSYAIYIVVVNRANLKTGALKLTFYAMIFCLLSLLVYSTFLGSGFPAIPTNLNQWGWGAMLGLVPTVLSLVFMAKSVKIVGSTPTAITGALEPLTAVVIGVCIFGESLTLRLITGIALILASVLLIAVSKKHS